jgi:hypothetical protein
MLSNAPKWVRLAIYGGVIAVALDYFLKPTMNKSLGL